MSGLQSLDARRVRLAFSVARPGFELAVDVDLPADGLTAVWGPSGAGKTTLLRVVAGLERARGLVRVSGEAWQDDGRGVFVSPHRRAVGYVFQDAALFPHLTVSGNLRYAYARRATSTSTPPRDIAGVAERLGISALLGRRPTTLSGGERQRVAIARALLAGPRLLLLDEPLASLDAAAKLDIVPYLERLRDELAIPVIYVTHSLDEVARLASHVVLLERGRVIASGETVETLARLDLPLACSEDGGVVIEARVAQHDEMDDLTRIDFDVGSLWLGRVRRAQGATVRVRVLARDVSIARERPGRSSILNVVAARVVELRDDGPDRVIVRLAAGSASLLARVTRRSRGLLALQAGDTVYALVKSVALIT